MEIKFNEWNCLTPHRFGSVLLPRALWRQSCPGEKIKHENLRNLRVLHSNLTWKLILEICLSRQEIKDTLFSWHWNICHLDVAPILLCWCQLARASQKPSWQSRSEGSSTPHKADLDQWEMGWTDKGFSSPDRCISKGSSEGLVGSSNQRPALLSELGCFLSFLSSPCLSVLFQRPHSNSSTQRHEPFFRMRLQSICFGHFANLNLCPSWSLECHLWTLSMLCTPLF